jgi:hypothetical protein
MLGRGVASTLQGLSESLEERSAQRSRAASTSTVSLEAVEAVRRALDTTASQLDAFSRGAADASVRARRSAGAAAGAAGGGVGGPGGGGGADTGAGAGAGASTATSVPEFAPGPAEMDHLVSSSYAVGRNLLVRFVNDEIDQSSALAKRLQVRFRGQGDEC